MTALAFFCAQNFWAAPVGAPAGASSREIFPLIESGEYPAAERKIQASLETAQGEDRNLYLFLLGFVLAKQDRPAEAAKAVTRMDPNSEWAEDGRFLIQTYGAGSTGRRGAGPQVHIEIAHGPSLTIGKDRFAHSAGMLRKNGKKVQGPFDLPSGVVHQGRSYRGKLQIVMEKSRVILVNSLPMEEYLYGVLKNEIGPGWHREALKAQAIASRTFVLRRIELALAASKSAPARLASDVSIQVYRGMTSEDPRVTAAVDATCGQVLTYRGELVEAVFHSESGGTTESSADLWGRAYPYLISRSDPYAGASPRVAWEAEFTEAELMKALDGRTRSKIGKIKTIEVSERSRGGRVKQLAFHGTRGMAVVPAGKYRISLGADKLRSLLWTDIVYKNRRLAVKGRGWGHGVGMPQWSAKAAAEQGLTCEQILDLYFPGTKITTRY